MRFLVRCLPKLIRVKHIIEISNPNQFQHLQNTSTRNETFVTQTIHKSEPITADPRARDNNRSLASDSEERGGGGRSKNSGGIVQSIPHQYERFAATVGDI